MLGLLSLGGNETGAGASVGAVGGGRATGATVGAGPLQYSAVVPHHPYSEQHSDSPLHWPLPTFPPPQ